MSDPNRTPGPEEAADRMFAAHEHENGRLDPFTERPTACVAVYRSHAPSKSGA